MVNIFEAYEMSKKLAEILTAAKFVYWENWEEVKKETIQEIEKHHKENKTPSLLSSAIRISWSDWKKQLLFLGAIADHLIDNNKK